MIELVLLQLLRASFFLAVGFPIAWLLIRFARLRSALGRRIAWGALLVVSLLCMTVPLQVPVASDPNPVETVTQKPEIVSYPPMPIARMDFTEAVSAPETTIAPEPEQRHHPAENTMPTSEDPTQAFAWLDRHQVFIAIFALWAFGLAVLLGRRVFAYASLRKLLKQAAPIDDPSWSALLQAYKIDAEKIPMLLTDSAGPALVRGPLHRLTLIVPGTLWEELEPELRTGVLRHELGHYRHGDAILSPILFFLASLQWFNPFAWLTLRRYDEATEWHADLFAYGERQNGSSELAETFLAIHRSTESLGLYMNSFSRFNTLDRVHRLLHAGGKEPIMKKFTVGIALVLLLCCGLFRVQLVAERKEENAGEKYRCFVKDVNGGPIADAAVVVRLLPKDGDSQNSEEKIAEYRMRSGSDGSFEFHVTEEQAGKPDMILHIQAAHPDYISNGLIFEKFDVFIEKRDLPEKDRGRTIILEPSAKVSGTVLMPDGKIARDILVYASSQDEHGNTTQTETRTGRDGRFKISTLPGKNRLLRILPSEAAPLSLTLEETDAELGTLRLQRGVVLEGRAVDFEGKPVGGLRLSLLVLESEGVRRHGHDASCRAAVTSPDGRFRFRPVMPDRYVLSPGKLMEYDLDGDGAAFPESAYVNLASTELWTGKPEPKREPLPNNDTVPFADLEVTLSGEPLQRIEYRGRQTVELTVRTTNDFMKSRQSLKWIVSGVSQGLPWHLEQPVPDDTKGDVILRIPAELKNGLLTLFDNKTSGRYLPMRFRFNDREAWSNNWYVSLDTIRKDSNPSLTVEPYEPGLLRVACLKPDGTPLSQNMISVKYANVDFSDPVTVTADGREIKAGIERRSPRVEFSSMEGRLTMWHFMPVLADEEFTLNVLGFDEEGRFDPVSLTLRLRSGEFKELVVPLKQRTESKEKPTENTYSLILLDANGEPVPEARVKVGDVSFGPEEVLAGQAGKAKQYFMTDANGRLVLKQKPYTDWFFYYVTTPGHALYFAEWHKPNPVPARFTARLDAALSVGGRIVDPDGKPIAGASLNLIVPAKRPPDDLSNSTPQTTVRSDEQGYWRCDYVPETLETLQMQISHPDFRSLPWTNVPIQDCRIASGATPTFRQTLAPGYVLTGKVTDREGKAIEGATVTTPDILWRSRSAVTDVQGVYRIRGLESGMKTLHIRAKEHASNFGRVAIGVNGEVSEGVSNFVLEKARPLRLEFVDTEGKPLEGISLSLSRYEKIDLAERDIPGSLRSDAEGRLIWNEAPVGSLNVSVQGNGVAIDIPDHPLRNDGDKEQRIVLQRPPVVLGRVVDSTDKRPVRSFTVTPGSVAHSFLNHENYTQYASWYHSDKRSFEGEDGLYRFPVNSPEHNRTMLIRIDSDGYKPGMYRVERKESNEIRFDVALEKAEGFEGRVLLPRSDEAASGAIVTLAAGAGASLNLSEGRITGYNDFSQQEADASGKYHFSKPEGVYCLVVTHKDGFALKWSDRFDPAEPVRLDAWSRVEGTLRLGDRTAPAGIRLALTCDVLTRKENGSGLWPSLNGSFAGTTDENGRFVIGPVPPGAGGIYQYVQCKFGKYGSVPGESNRREIQLEPGKTMTIELGGTGRAVVGRVRSKESAVDWRYCMVSLVKPGGPDYPSLFAAAVLMDGTFRIDDVAPGEYRVTARLYSTTSDDFEMVGKVEKRFMLPDSEQDKEAFDLGTLQLESVEPGRSY